MHSKRIIASCDVELQPENAPTFVAEVDALSRAALAALGKAATGLGLASGDQTGARLQEASIILLGASPSWSAGTELATRRAQDPRNTDLAFQWCFHLFSRLTVASPFDLIGADERLLMENKIETTVLEHLPSAEDNPLHMLCAAKLLYFVDRGHLELAEDLAERALARSADPTASCALLGQLRYASGRFDEAVQFFDRGAARRIADHACWRIARHRSPVLMQDLFGPMSLPWGDPHH